jgi:hypothetical protein
MATTLATTACVTVGSTVGLWRFSYWRPPALVALGVLLTICGDLLIHPRLFRRRLGRWLYATLGLSSEDTTQRA